MKQKHAIPLMRVLLGTASAVTRGDRPTADHQDGAFKITEPDNIRYRCGEAPPFCKIRDDT